jgi:arylsulfatase A-like enzyme
MLVLVAALAVGGLAGGCARSSGGGGEAEAASPPERPNIVLIMADDMGRETVGAYGGTSYRTPHLDRLAATGVRFDRAFAQPLCTPSRVQIMTGQYNFRNYEKFGHLDPSETTFANVLREAGYATGVVGKWQLQGDRQTPHGFGFDEYLLWQLQPGDYWYRYKDPVLVGHDTPRDTLRGAYGPARFAAFAEGFIDRHRAEPFFLYYPMALPHRPFQPTPRQEAAYAEADFRSLDDTTHFRHMVEYVDHAVGRVVDRLEEAGVRDNTLLIFTGDNGTDTDVVSGFGRRRIRGDKGHTTAAGTHVPLIVSWPAQAQAGAVGGLVDFVDFLPTVADAAGVPPEERPPNDGVSLVPAIRGTGDVGREWIFTDYNPRGRPFEPRRYVQDERYKLYDDGAFYDTRRDPAEQTPLREGELSAEALRHRTVLEVALRRMNREVAAARDSAAAPDAASGR